MAKGTTVDFNANVASFEDGVDSMLDKLEEFGREVDVVDEKTEKSFKSLGYAAAGLGTVAVGGVAALVALTKQAHNTAEAIDTAASKTGFGVEQFQELRWAADQTNVSIGELDTGLETFTRRLGEARMGMGEASKVYKELGVDLNQSQDQIFRQVVETIGTIEDEANRMALVSKLFGESSQALANTFKDGVSGIDAYASQARNLGIVLDDDLVKGASAANQEFANFQKVINAQTTRILLEFAPAIVDIGDAFARAAPHVAGFFEAFGLGVRDEDKFKEIFNRSYELKKQIEQRVSYISQFKGPEFAVADMRREVEAWKKELTDLESQMNMMRDKNVTEIKSKNKETPASGDTKSLFGTGGGDEAEKEAEKQRKRFAASLESLNQTVALLGVTTQYEKTLWDVQNGRYKDLSDNQKKALLDAAKRVDQKTADIEATKEAAKSEEEAAKAAERLNTQLEAQADRWRSITNPANDVYDQMAELDTLLEKGKISWDTYGDAMFQVMGGLEEEATKTEDKWKDLGLTFSSAFEDAIVSGENLSDVLQGLEKDIARIVTRKLVTEPLGNFVGGIADSFLSSYDGGGFTGLGSRSGGMDGKGGFLAMLHPNETVIDHTKTNRGSSGMRVVNNITVSSPDGNLSTQSLNQLQTALARSMQRSLARNS